MARDNPVSSSSDDKHAHTLLARLKPVLERESGRGGITVSHYLEHRLEQEASGHVPPPLQKSESGSGFFSLKNVVAAGGMGAILSAEDQNILRTVALKVINTNADLTEDKIHRFVAEARITGQLEHPNIVPLYEMGVAEDGTLFYTMRLVEGTTLSDILHEIRMGNKEIIARHSLAQLLTVFQKICDAIAYAHSRGVAHRDLKPDNIMIGEFGEVLVMDWGLAKLLPEAHEVDLDSDDYSAAARPRQLKDSLKTLDGLVKGTPRYMAPEQAEGKVDKIDARTDIYSLGAMLYTILTLHPPVTGETIREVLEKVATGEITPPTTFNTRAAPPGSDTGRIVDPATHIGVNLAHCPDGKIPSALSAVTMKAMSRRQEDRYQTVTELQAEITAYQGGYATSAEKAGTFTLMLLMLKRHKTEYLLITAAFVIILAVAGVFMVKVTNTLGELRETAPLFYTESIKLLEGIKFAKALSKIDYALKLQKNNPDFHVLRGNILQCQLRIGEAQEAYATALQFAPNHRWAAENLKLCEAILADPRNKERLSQESLSQLRAAMLNQNRKHEADFIQTKLSKTPLQILESWRGVLKRVNIEGNLTNDATGLLHLDLSHQPINDLAPLKDMPLGSLNLVDSAVTDLSPLEGATNLTTLDFSQTAIKDLAALSKLPLQRLLLARTPVADLAPLKYRPLSVLDASYTKVRDLAPLKAMPLTRLDLRGTEVSDLAILKELPLTMLLLDGCDGVKDFTVLAECKQLEFLTVPASARGIEGLKENPKLKRLAVFLPESGWESATTPEEFWKAYDERSK